MRAIDADELKRKYAGWYNVYGKNKSIRCVEVKEIDWMPTIDAVPLEPLCKWLADNYEPPANVSNGKALDDHEFCVTLWRYVLGKMMEEQDAD